METDLTIVTPTETDLMACLPPVRDIAEVPEEFSSFLPNLTLVQGNSPLTYAPHNCKPGTIVLKKGKSIQDLGEAVDGAILDWRHRAVWFASDGIKNSFYPLTPLYQEIKAVADSGKKSPSGLAEAQFGYEFLVYLADIGAFAQLYCSTVSARYSANDSFFPLLRKTAPDGSLATVTIYSEDRESKQKRFKAWASRMSQMPFTYPIDMTVAARHIRKFADTAAAEATEETAAVLPEDL